MTRLVITGGTGTLGVSLLNLITRSSRLTNLIYSEVVVFSRNEASQYSLKKEFGDSINCVIGDVRDFEALYKLFEDGDHVIHAAAIKHIDIAEKILKKQSKQMFQARLHCQMLQKIVVLSE
jgi:nucleoside-diphosphate-sugar epimerase